MENQDLQYLEILARSSNQVVFVYQMATNQFSYLNQAIEKVWSRNRQNVLKNPASLWKTIHPEDQDHVKQNYQDLVEGALIPEVQFRINPRNRPERWINVRALLLEDEQVIIGQAEDITESKQYNDYLKKYSEKKNAILNILSHDLAGPLGLIQSLSQALQEDLKSYENQEVHELIKLIENNSKRGTQLIQEFLRQEFLESSQVHVNKNRVDLVYIIKQALEEYQQTQHLTGKHFHFQTTSENIYLDLDDTKFMQAINNLISNALKFTPDGGEIAVRIQEKENTVLITVADNGIGIPAKYHATLFEKFTPARRPGVKGEPSVGLGMSIIKTIIEWHQGQIWFESAENKGTTFFIEIPKN